MIEFKGELSGKCRKYMLDRQNKITIYAALFVALIFAIPTVIIGIFLEPLALIFCVLYVFIIVYPLIFKDKGNNVLPTRVYVDIENHEIVSESEHFCYGKNISLVEQVIDMGEWYRIVFCLNEGNVRFVCQKSLLTQGTLEEFEALFEGKIVRQDSDS